MKIFKHEFIDNIPKFPEEGILYVSIKFSTCVHLCACGCGEKVVTPISPKDWKLTFHGDSVSLYPSIGNYNYECNSHYFIFNNKVNWVPKWKVNYQRSKKKKRRIRIWEIFKRDK